MKRLKLSIIVCLIAQSQPALSCDWKDCLEVPYSEECREYCVEHARMFENAWGFEGLSLSENGKKVLLRSNLHHNLGSKLMALDGSDRSRLFQAAAGARVSGEILYFVPTSQEKRNAFAIDYSNVFETTSVGSDYVRSVGSIYQQEFGEAIDSASAVIDKMPKAPYGWHARALALALEDRVPDAERDAIRAFELYNDPRGKAAVLQALNLAYARTGSWEQLYRNSLKVQKMEDESPYNAFFLWIASDKLGKRSESEHAKARWMSYVSPGMTSTLDGWLASDFDPYLAGRVLGE